MHPGATETCNGVDDDCDHVIDEGTSCFDDDGDCFCEQAPCAGSVHANCASIPGGDCADQDAAVYPAAAEIMGNGIDDDCDDVLDGGGLDADHDGWLADAGDCDPADGSVHPGATEAPDGKDNDCDGVVDEGTARFDDDGDCACESAPCSGSVSTGCGALVGDDCDDASADIGPDATENPSNGVDDDCNGLVDDGGPQVDDDGDGLSEVQGDCNDEDPNVVPGARELDNGIDDDCDGEIDEDFEDLDRDGVTVADGDCDDHDGWVHPGLAEMCDSIDTDCDGDVDEGCDEGDIPVDDSATPPQGCHCDTTPAVAPWWAILALAPWLRRRRAA